MDREIWNMNTRRQSGKWKGERSLNSDFPFSLSPFPFSARSAFTLTELLVVITIIAILASLITAGAMNAMRRGQEAAITLEIGQLADAVERFKTETLGGAYPPNGMSTGTALVGNDFVRTFRKAFPRHNEPDGLIRALAGDAASTLSGAPKFHPPANGTDGPLPNGLTAKEAVYFWLGGFSTDPVYPLSGPGGPSFVEGDFEDIEGRNRLYEFALERLGPRENDVFSGRAVSYTNPLGTGRRRINLWTYTPKGSEVPYVYFDASRYDPGTYDLDLSGGENLGIFGIKRLREGRTVANTADDVVFVNKGKFQILHAGLDGEWGANFGNVATLFPAGPFTGELADTLTNFTTGTLENAQE